MAYETRYNVETGWGDVLRAGLKTRKRAIEIALDEKFASAQEAEAEWQARQEDGPASVPYRVIEYVTNTGDKDPTCRFGRRRA